MSGDGILPAEVLFGVDLPGGLEVGLVENDGEVSLTLGASSEYIVQYSSAGSAPVEISSDVNFDTAFIDADPQSDTFVWSAVAAEEDLDVTDGFRILWEATDEAGVVTDYRIAEYDASGAFTGPAQVIAIENIATEGAEFNYVIDEFVYVIV